MKTPLRAALAVVFFVLVGALAGGPAVMADGYASGTVFYGNIPMRWGDRINNHIDAGTDYGETITYMDNDGNEQTLGSKAFDALDRNDWDYIVDVKCCAHSPYHYGMWAELPNGNSLFAIEMKPNDSLGTYRAAGTEYEAHWRVNPPALSGVAKYDGGIVGTHVDGEHFEGSVFAHVDLDRMTTVDLTIHDFYEGHFPHGFEKTYSLPIRTTVRNGVTVPTGAGSPWPNVPTTDVNFYGAGLEGIAGTITHPAADIRFSIFGATRRNDRP